MKKIFGILAIAMLMVVACNKENNQGGSSASDYNYDTPKLEPAVNQENSMSFVVNSGDAQDGMRNPDGEIDKIEEGVLPPSETGVLVYENAGPVEVGILSVEGPSKAVGAGMIYHTTLGDITVVSLSGKDASLKFAFGAEEIVVSGNVSANPVLTPFQRDINRGWIIEETIIKVTGDNIPASLGAAKSFKGCPVSQISEYLSEKGAKIEIVSADYDVKKIVLDPSGKFSIFFKGINPYYGNYTLNGNAFSYSFKYMKANNPVIAGSASGNINALANGIFRMEISGSMKDNKGANYSANVIFKLRKEK